MAEHKQSSPAETIISRVDATTLEGLDGLVVQCETYSPGPRSGPKSRQACVSGASKHAPWIARRSIHMHVSVRI